MIFLIDPQITLITWITFVVFCGDELSVYKRLRKVFLCVDCKCYAAYKAIITGSGSPG